MNGVNIGSFDLSAPPDSQSAGLGDDHIRSVKSTLQQALNDEHVFDSAGGVVGAHRLGAARAYFGTQSAVSSSGTDGRLMIASDSSRLFAVGSAGTLMLGAGPTALALASGYLTYPQRSVFVEEVGYGITGASGVTTLTFPNSGYSGVPYVFLSSMYTNTSTDPVIAFSHKTVDGATCEVRAVTSGSLYSGGQFIWRSLGSRTL